MRNILVATVLAASIATASVPALAADTPKYSTAETDIGTLLDDPAACAILDKHMPNFSKGDQLSLARPFTLKSIQQYAQDTITDDALTKIDAELARLPTKK